MIDEIWRKLTEYDNLYEISNLGRVKRLPKKVTNTFGTFISKEIILKGSISTHGYMKQTLTKNGKQTTVLVHRLVAQNFLSNDEKKEMVNHINGIKSDNRLSNLEWATSSENIRHALDTKLIIPRCGSDIYFSKFTEKDVSIILYKGLIQNISSQILSKELGINNRTIADILKRRTWSHVECPDELCVYDLNHYENLIKDGNIKSKIISQLKTNKNIKLKDLEDFLIKISEN